MEFSPIARWLGIFSAATAALLIVVYAVTLVVGFLSLASPSQPIGDPMFTILEILIIVMIPVLVALMAAGLLALAGLSGVVFGDMQLRNIGIVGYVPVFLVVAVLLAFLFYQTPPREGLPNRERLEKKSPLSGSSS